MRGKTWTREQLTVLSIVGQHFPLDLVARGVGRSYCGTQQKLAEIGLRRTARSKSVAYRAGSRKRHSAMLLTVNGQTRHLADWCAQAGLSRRVVRERLASGWTPEESISVPVGAAPRRPRRA